MEPCTSAAAPGPGSESERPQASFTTHSSGHQGCGEPGVVQQPPEALWRHCVGQAWEPKSVPTSITLTKRTLKNLFAWQYGSSKQHVPSVIFKLAIASGEVVTLPPVSLNAPSRDDSVRLEKKELGQGKPKVDGYPVPAETVRQIYGLLGVQSSGRIQFVSEGWQDGCLRGAAGSNLQHLAAAAAAASAGQAAAAGSPLPVSNITTAARSGWLSGEQVLELLSCWHEHGLRIVDALSTQPRVGDLFLCRKGNDLWKIDEHDWGERRNGNLKVKGQDAIKVFYFKTKDGMLQVRGFSLLDETAPNAHLQLLQYHRAPQYASEKSKPGPKPKRKAEDGPSPHSAKRQAGPATSLQAVAQQQQQRRRREQPSEQAPEAEGHAQQQALVQWQLRCEQAERQQRETEAKYEEAVHACHIAEARCQQLEQQRRATAAQLEAAQEAARSAQQAAEASKQRCQQAEVVKEQAQAQLAGSQQELEAQRQQCRQAEEARQKAADHLAALQRKLEAEREQRKLAEGQHASAEQALAEQVRRWQCAEQMRHAQEAELQAAEQKQQAVEAELQAFRAEKHQAVAAAEEHSKKLLAQLAEAQAAAAEAAALHKQLEAAQQQLPAGTTAGQQGRQLPSATARAAAVEAVGPSPDRRTIAAALRTMLAECQVARTSMQLFLKQEIFEADAEKAAMHWDMLAGSYKDGDDEGVRSWVELYAAGASC
ncbi:hypothetical protein ABPG75_003452 [Micractinium tetrahymenae]